MFYVDLENEVIVDKHQSTNSEKMQDESEYS